MGESVMKRYHPTGSQMVRPVSAFKLHPRSGVGLE
jgi:hypothetical protein